MAESIQLLRGVVPPDLRPSWLSLEVPIHNEAVVVGGNRKLYDRGRVCVRLTGLPVNYVEVWRQDDETILGGSGQTLQVEIIKQEETIKEWPVFAYPLGSLALTSLGNHNWVADTKGVQVLEEGGLNWFCGVLMSFVLDKQPNPAFQRPAVTEPEL